MSVATEKELLALEKFRVRLADLCLRGERSTDRFLLRWLRARELNVNLAEDMLRKSLAWRAQNNIDKILEWSVPPDILEELPLEMCGEDSDGCPVIIIPYGKWNVRALIDSGNKDLYNKFLNRLFESMIDLMKSKSTDEKLITNFNVIMDTEGLSFRQLASVATVDTTLEIVKRYEANYPETLKQAYIVNASRTFTIIFGLIRPFLTSRQLGKIQIFASDAAKWKPAIAARIPVDQLPIYFGGSRESSLPFYNQVITTQATGKTISARPMSMMLEDEVLIAVTVDAGKKLNLQFDVIQPSSNLVLRWNYRTDDHDIGFSVVLNENSVLVQYSRVDSHLEMQYGSVTCDKPGRYTLCFDNTYSRLRAKTLHYFIHFGEI